ncbi:MAG: hypothetical protein ACRCZM_05515 [Bacteroidales bacterium]
MTPVQKQLSELSEEQRGFISTHFGSTDKFYQFVYLIAQNEHQTQMQKADRMEDRLAVIHQVQDSVEKMVDSIELSGYDVMADIKSDYLEDWLAQRSVELIFTNEEFIEMIHRVSNHKA